MTILTDYAKQPHIVSSPIPSTDSRFNASLGSTANNVAVSENALLGNSTNIPSNIQKVIISADHKARSRRFTHLASAKKILKQYGILSPQVARKDARDGSKQKGDYSIHRIRTCLDKKSYTADNITIKLSDSPAHSSASFAGAAPCGCIWGCPVCAPKISTQKQSEVKQVFEWAESNGYVIFLLHLTARHDNTMSLDYFKGKFKDAWSLFTSGGGWKKVREKYGIEHYIANVEPLYNLENGWHYHKHVALLIPAEKILDGEHYKEIETMLRYRWMNNLASVGLSGIDEIALKITVDGNVKDHYLTKLNIAEEDLTGSGVHEIASSATKNGSTGLTCWQLLEQASNGDKEAAKRYAEFVDEMSGDNWITASKGLWKLAGVDVMDETEAAEQDDKNEAVMSDWMTISEAQWSNVRYFRVYSQVLDVAALTRDKAAVIAYLDKLEAERDKRESMPVNYRKKPMEALLSDKQRLLDLISKFRDSARSDHIKRLNYWKSCLRALNAELERRELFNNPLFDFYRK